MSFCSARKTGISATSVPSLSDDETVANKTDSDCCCARSLHPTLRRGAKDGASERLWLFEKSQMGRPARSMWTTSPPTLATMRPSRRWGTRICGEVSLSGQFHPTLRKTAKDGIPELFVVVRKNRRAGTHSGPWPIERDPFRQISLHSVQGKMRVAGTECRLLRSATRGSDAKHHLRAAV